MILVEEFPQTVACSSAGQNLPAEAHTAHSDDFSSCRECMCYCGSSDMGRWKEAAAVGPVGSRLEEGNQGVALLLRP